MPSSAIRLDDLRFSSSSSDSLAMSAAAVATNKPRLTIKTASSSSRLASLSSPLTSPSPNTARAASPQLGYYRDTLDTPGDVDAPLLGSPSSIAARKRLPASGARRRRQWTILLVACGLSLVLMTMYWQPAPLVGQEVVLDAGKKEEAPRIAGEGLPPTISPSRDDLDGEWKASQVAAVVDPIEEIQSIELEEEEEEEESGRVSVLPPPVEATSAEEAAMNAEEQEEEAELDLLEAAHASEVALPTLNIRPHPRLPPSDPVTAGQMRYISYENHSGFHNQRKSLINALLIAKLLNRTLLLPPARLGYAAPWQPELESIIPWEERCKAGTPLPTDEPCGTMPDRWTYVGWSYLLDDELFRDRAIVDRWNGSMEWMYDSPASGGLGLTPDDVERFSDNDRRSYQLYDDRRTKTNLQQFTSRIDLEDLSEGELKDKRLLHFGSLFSGGRLNLKKQETLDEVLKISESIVFQIDKVDGISDEIRDALGTYVGVHLRVGDGIFKNNAKANMHGVFRKLCKNVFNLKQSRITALLAESTERGAAKALSRSKRSGIGSSTAVSWRSTDDNEDDELDSDSPVALIAAQLHKRAPITRRPLSPALTCRSALHTNPELLPLNTPLYIATDSRSPMTDPALAPFFHHFPCAFLLDDFAKRSEVNQKPVDALVEMVSDKWTSEWDGQALAKYLYPFLEAEIAAKSIAVVGTPQSTFSGYTAGTLHEAYQRQGKTAERARARARARA